MKISFSGLYFYGEAAGLCCQLHRVGELNEIMSAKCLMHIEWLIYSLQCYYYYLISLFLSLYFSMSIDTSIYPFVLLLLIIFLAGNLLGFMPVRETG